jgi:hypothetical protein
LTLIVQPILEVALQPLVFLSHHCI